MQIAEAKLDVVTRAGNFLGESPLWCPRTCQLYWINCEREPTLFRYDPATGGTDHWPMPMRIGAVALKTGGGLLIALADGVYTFAPDTGALDQIAAAPDPETVVLHEGKCDRQGRFWIGSLSKRMQSHGQRGGAKFYRLDGANLVPQIDDLSVANGLAWSPDGATMYHTDTPAGCVWAYDYDTATAEISNRRVLFTVPADQGGLDGAAVDAEGGYWTALFRGSCVRRYHPNGHLDRELRLPFSQPTMPAFGGDGLSTLYLTTTRYGDHTGPSKEPGLGDLYSIAGCGPGLPEAEWVGI